jgi:hypothetical protein
MRRHLPMKHPQSIGYALYAHDIITTREVSINERPLVVRFAHLDLNPHVVPDGPDSIQGRDSPFARIIFFTRILNAILNRQKNDS